MTKWATVGDFERCALSQLFFPVSFQLTVGRISLEATEHSRASINVFLLIGFQHRIVRRERAHCVS